METPFNLSIPSAKTIMVCGDIHGEFNLLVYKLCIQYKMRDTLLHLPDKSPFARNLYWENEPPVYDETLLASVGKKFSIDAVVTHSAPAFCELTSKSMVVHFAQKDPELLGDVQKERETMELLFHQSWNAIISGVRFKMLDIMEFAEIRPL